MDGRAVPQKEKTTFLSVAVDSACWVQDAGCAVDEKEEGKDDLDCIAVGQEHYLFSSVAHALLVSLGCLCQPERSSDRRNNSRLETYGFLGL